ncbi:hypothetical protein [Streptomyces sp. NPDC059631]|uniref:hypothetical protein n=1 Tax=unclassified Streptomyces TaxID=2593676 RepID=UPI0036B3BEA2
MASISSGPTSRALVDSGVIRQDSSERVARSRATVSSAPWVVSVAGSPGAHIERCGVHQHDLAGTVRDQVAEDPVGLLSGGRYTFGASTTRRTIRSGGQGPVAGGGFQPALRAPARDLDAAPSPVDYRRRRIALNNWSLGTREWQEILRALPRPRVERYPCLDDYSRQGASAFVWAHITQGEPRFAPRPIVLSHGQTKSDRHPWPTKCNNMWFHIGAASTSHYAALRTLLIEVGDDLARKIDTSRPER